MLKLLDQIGGIITYIRNFFINAIFLLLLLLFFFAFLISASLSGSDEILDTNEIIYIDISNTIYDAPLMESKVDRLVNAINGVSVIHIHTDELKQIFENAAHDHDVKAIVLNLSSTRYIRMDTLRELEPAIRKFKDAKKDLMIYSDSYNQSTYALASYGTRIGMSPLGMVEIAGCNARNLYFKDFLDKVNVTVFTPKAGTHKSAVEPFNRNDMSELVKTEMTGITGELWQQYTDIIAKNRPKVDINSFLFASDSLLAMQEETPYYNNVYQQKGVIDLVLTEEDFLNEVSKKYDVKLTYNATSHRYTFDTVSADEYYNMIVDRASARRSNSQTGNIGIIYGLGDIAYDDPNNSDLSTFSPEHIIPLIQKATTNKYSALVLYMNTPGGSVDASEAIRTALVNYKKKTGGKVIVYMSGMTASGGYWISTVADTIIAQPSTITGSIGVFGIMFNAHNLTNEIGLHEDGVGNNPEGVFSVATDFSENQKRMIQYEINRTYEKFISLVSESRKIDQDDVRELAQGKIYTGSKALEIHLIDKIGTFKDAVEEAKKIAGNYKNVNILLPDDHGNNINIVTRTLIKAVAKYDRPLALTMFDSMIKQHPVVKAATRKDYRQMVQPYSFDN